MPLLQTVLPAKWSAWSSRRTTYNIDTGKGPYFDSSLRVFLEEKLGEYCLCVFPDEGAFRRFSPMVKNINEEAIVAYLPKTRNGGDVQSSTFLRTSVVEQQEGNNYEHENVSELIRKITHAKKKAIIIDDFTNSGSTLFKAADTLSAEFEDVDFDAYVTHFVAQYNEEKIKGFITRFKISSLKSFHMTDSVAFSTNILRSLPCEKPIEIRSIADTFVSAITEVYTHS